MSHPVSVCIAIRRDDVYVAVRRNAGEDYIRVVNLKSKEKNIRKFGSHTFHGLSDIAIAENAIFVADNSRIQAFRFDGSRLCSWYRSRVMFPRTMLTVGVGRVNKDKLYTLENMLTHPNKWNNYKHFSGLLGAYVLGAGTTDRCLPQPQFQVFVSPALYPHAVLTAIADEIVVGCADIEFYSSGDGTFLRRVVVDGFDAGKMKISPLGELYFLHNGTEIYCRKPEGTANNMLNPKHVWNKKTRVRHIAFYGDKLIGLNHRRQFVMLWPNPRILIHAPLKY